MRPAAHILFVVLLLLRPCAAFADASSAPDCEVPMTEVTRAVLDDLIGWIALRTDYDLSTVYRDPPEIVFCEIGDIVDYEGDGLLVDKALAAAYDLTRRRIYLVRPWTADDVFDRSVLLHELVHVTQLDNRDWPCTGAPELEAYQLQSVWLQDHGILPRFDWQAIYRMSQCPAETLE